MALKKKRGIKFFMSDKGGPGKSTVAMSYIEYRQNMGVQVEIVDCDTGTPDVSKTFEVKTVFSFLRADGFMDFVNHIDSVDGDREIVVNFSAGSNEQAKVHGQAFLQALPRLPELVGRPLVVCWVADNKRDVLESLSDFYNESRLTIDFVRNLHHGPESSFELFNNSNIRKMILKAGGQVMDFPALAPRVMVAKANKRLTVAKTGPILSLGDRLELERWWREVTRAFDQAGYGDTEFTSRKRGA